MKIYYMMHVLFSRMYWLFCDRPQNMLIGAVPLKCPKTWFYWRNKTSELINVLCNLHDVPSLLSVVKSACKLENQCLKAAQPSYPSLHHDYTGSYSIPLNMELQQIPIPRHHHIMKQWYFVYHLLQQNEGNFHNKSMFTLKETTYNNMFSQKLFYF